MAAEEKRMKFNLQNDPLVQLVSPRVGDFLVLGSNPFGVTLSFLFATLATLLLCNPRECS